MFSLTHISNVVGLHNMKPGLILMHTVHNDLHVYVHMYGRLKGGNFDIEF